MLSKKVVGVFWKRPSHITIAKFRIADLHISEQQKVVAVTNEPVEVVYTKREGY